MANFEQWLQNEAIQNAALPNVLSLTPFAAAADEEEHDILDDLDMEMDANHGQGVDGPPPNFAPPVLGWIAANNHPSPSPLITKRAKKMLMLSPVTPLPILLPNPQHRRKRKIDLPFKTKPKPKISTGTYGEVRAIRQEILEIHKRAPSYPSQLSPLRGMALMSEVTKAVHCLRATLHTRDINEIGMLLQQAINVCQTVPVHLDCFPLYEWSSEIAELMTRYELA